MNDTLEKKLNNEADRFVSDMMIDSSLFYEIYKKTTGIKNSDDLLADLDDLLASNEFDYATDAQHLVDRIDYHKSTNLNFWLGYYSLISKEYKGYNLVISVPNEEKAESDLFKEVNVYLQGLKLVDYTFINQTLKWDFKKEDGRSLKGELSFSGFLENLGETKTNISDYFGPLCKGEIQMNLEDDSIEVKGKQGVFNADAVLGDYSENESPEYWTGSYSILSNEDPGNISTLSVATNSNGKPKVILDGDDIHDPIFNGGALTWEGKKSKNKSISRLSFVQAPGQSKFVTGKLRKASDDDFVDVSGIQTKIMKSDKNLEIITKNLLPAVATEAYAAVVEAEGGKEPYKWEVKNPEGAWSSNEKDKVKKKGNHLPDSLKFENGIISGSVDKPGVYIIDFKVTDSLGKDDTTRLVLKVSGSSRNDVIQADAKSWLIPALAALAGILSAIIGAKAKSFFDERARKQTEEAKKGVEAQRPEIKDFNNASSDADRKKYILKEGEYRRKALAEIRERAKIITDKLTVERIEIQKEIFRRQRLIETASDADRLLLEERIGELQNELNEKNNMLEEASRDIPPEEREEEVENPPEDAPREGV